VPLDGDIILLVGPNGSGKTTFLDALRVLMNGQRLSKGRTLHHYIQKDVELAMIKGVVTNQLVGTRRPFAHLGIYGDVDVSLICLIYNHGVDKIEKEYFILKGDIPVEQIKDLKGSLRPLQYSRYLEEAGVSRSTLKLIALEQGQTDRIGQLDPNELLQLVMDITGNREIIKKYEEARLNYRRSSQQLIEMRTEYNKICQQTRQLEQQAKEAQTFKELLGERKIIEQEKLPLARWYHCLNQIALVETSYQEIQQKKIALEKRIQTILQEQQTLQGKITQIEKDQQSFKQRQQEKDQELQRLHQQIGQSQSEWQRLDTLRQQAEEVHIEEDQATLQKELDQSKEQYYQLKNQLTQAQEQLQSLRKERDQMSRRKLPSFPDEVDQFRAVLQQNKIDHLLFAEGIEITNPKWQLAIEAFLGRERFSIVVHPKDFLRAKKLGEQHRYGFYISPFDSSALPSKIHPNSALANVKPLDPRIQGRLSGLNDILLVDTVEQGHQYPNDITITVQGYRQDRRGGIFIARDVRFYCGGLAIEKQLNDLNEQITTQKDLVDRLTAELQKINSKIQENEKKMAAFQIITQWQASQKRYEELQKQGEELLRVVKELGQQRNQIATELEEFSESKTSVLTEQRELQREKDRIEREQRQLDDNLQEKQEMLQQLRWQKEELNKLIPAPGQAAYTPDQLETPEWLNRKLQDLIQNIERFPGCKDLALIPLYEHEQKELESKKTQLDRQEQDQEQRTQELELCRKDYKEMIDQTINFYNKSVKELAILAGCKMRVVLEWGKGEALVEDAKLFVKVGFDQKHEVDIHDKSLSGGQDVISSLILLIGLSQIEEERGSGFFIMDEHNAHLDMLRIMEVGRFLRSTKAQFVLTTPTTENVAALSVADLIMTFSKRDAPSRYAPKPRYIRRM